MRYYLGIDAGTTSMKAALFDESGRMVGVAREEYELLTPHPAWVEAGAEVYWRACCAVVRHAVAQSGVRPEHIATLAISSQAETLVAVDADGCPVRPVIVWLDNRAVTETAMLRERFGDALMFRISGQPEIVPTWPAAKILWIKRHEPGAFARTVRFLLLEDYLLFRLTGRYVTELSLQSDSQLVDFQARRWWAPMLDYLELTENHFGTLVEPGTNLGPLQASGAAEAGLATSTLAVSGALDQMVGAVGAGNIATGIVSETTGGAMAVVVTLAGPHLDPSRRIPCFIHASPGGYCLLPWVQTAGLALKWFRDEFFASETAAALQAGREPYEIMTGAAAGVAPGCDGMVALPHLEGAASPEFNPAAKAVFFGATLRHGRGHFVRALMESVAFMLKKNLDLVEGMGLPVAEVRSIGGGARSPLWLQIKADVLGKPVRTVVGEETACLGAAILGAVAAGHQPTLAAAVGQMVRLAQTVEPDPRIAPAYAEAYARYNELYDRLAPMFR